MRYPKVTYPPGAPVRFKVRAIDRGWRRGIIASVDGGIVTLRSEHDDLYEVDPAEGRIDVLSPRKAESLARPRRKVSAGSQPCAAQPVMVTTDVRPTAQPKPRAKVRNAGYLAFVRKRACCSCGIGGPSDPHHHGPRGVGQKADDLRCVPLCRPCHEHITVAHVLPGMSREQTELLIARHNLELLIEWFAAHIEPGHPAEID